MDSQKPVAPPTTGLDAAASEACLRAFLRESPSIAWIKDEGGHYLFASRIFEQYFSIAEYHWLGRRDQDLGIDREFAEACAAADQRVLDADKPHALTGPMRAADGLQRQWRLLRFPFRAEDGRRYLGAIATDVTEEYRLEQALADSEGRLKGLVDHSPVVVWMKDASGRYVYLSRSYEQRFHVRLDDYRGKTDFDFNTPETARRFEETDQMVIRHGQSFEAVEQVPDPSGEKRHWWVMKFPFQNAAGERFVGGVGVDITERKRGEDSARLESLTDPLTGLYNRRGFMMLVEQEFQLARVTPRHGVLFFADLDGLKSINDKYGHVGGDRALAAVAEQLRVSFREADIISRHGGDEFVVLALNCRDPEQLVQRLRQNLSEFNKTDELPYPVSLSVGWAPMQPQGGETLEAFLTAADRRMYEAKRQRQ